MLKGIHVHIFRERWESTPALSMLLAIRNVSASFDLSSIQLFNNDH